VPAPGPSGEQARGAADEVIDSFAGLLAAGDASNGVGDTDDVPSRAASEG
jgi:oligoribonuclease